MILKIVCAILVLYLVISHVIFVLKVKKLKTNESKKDFQSASENALSLAVSSMGSKESLANSSSLRVAKYAKEIARRMGKSEKEQQEVFYAGLLRDIEKIKLPENLAKKNGEFSETELECIKFYTMISYNMLSGISESSLIGTAGKYHNERYDGTGTPEGLKGEQIPEYARILAVADGYDMLTSKQGYKNVFPQSFVKAEIQADAGKRFDPKIAQVMIDMINDDKSFKMRESQRGPKKLLYIDDDPVALKALEAMLKTESDYEVICARNGKAGLKIMKSKEFDLVILDIFMTDKMSGFEIFDRIKASWDVPVIFISSNKDPETIMRANEEGAAYYLIKPFLRQELLEAMESIFDKQAEI